MQATGIAGLIVTRRRVAGDGDRKFGIQLLRDLDLGRIGFEHGIGELPPPSLENGPRARSSGRRYALRCIPIMRQACT